MSASQKSALAWTATWIAVAGLFGLGVWHVMGAERAGEFYAAYLLEKSLSVDNLFVFMVVFRQLRIPREAERRILTWGILGALVMRAGFLAVGVTVLTRWHALVYVLGALLVATGVKLVATRSPEEPQEESKLLRWLERKLPTTQTLRGGRFFVREGGRLLATPLLLALVTIELTDVAFALDSVPAAFAVSEDLFILYSSNVLAMLGLRALYVVIASSLTRSRELEVALSAVLVFAGAKMLLAHHLHVPPALSVGVIASCLGTAILVRTVRRRRAAPA